MKNHTYVIGDNPYDNCQGWRQKGNGKWSCAAPTLQKALETIFGSMIYPTELTGRKLFLNGVSRPELAEYEVIQVWSTDPTVVEHTRSLKPEWDHWPHVGGTDIGLACEVSVYEVERYMVPQRLMLTQGATPLATTSEVGVVVSDFHRNRFAMQKSIQEARWDLSVAKWGLDRKRNSMNLQVQKMNEQIFLADTYLRGADNTRQLTTGTRGSGPYHIFQERQFLNKEVALLANMEDFGFEQLDQLEDWMVRTGAWKKMLPFDRCVLVTRVRDQRKDYGDPFQNAFMSGCNLTSIIWIRDGENCWRILSEVEFDNAVLTDVLEEQRVTDWVTNHVFESIYNETHTDWRGNPVEPAKHGTINPKATEERGNVYIPHTKYPRRFKTIEDWMASEDYTLKVKLDIAKAVAEHMSETNKKRLVFAIFIQGVIDTTTVLDIPRGTNVFDWSKASTFFTLHTNYSHGLPDGQARDEWKNYNTSNVVYPGETIIVDTRDLDTKREHLYRRPSHLRFYTVRKLVDGCPMIAHHPSKRYYPYEPTKGAKNVVLKDVPFLRVALPLDLANRLIGDRDWKETNYYWVPIMAQWINVREQAKTCKNFDKVVLKGHNED